MEGILGGSQGEYISPDLLINAKLFSKLVSLQSHQQCMSVPLFFALTSALVIITLHFLPSQGCVGGVSHCSLFCISLIPMSLSTDWPFGFLFVCEVSILVTCPFSSGLSVFFLLICQTTKFLLIYASFF